VAVLIELANLLGKSLLPDRSVVFVTFAGEEAGKKGLQHYATNEKQYPVKQCKGNHRKTEGGGEVIGPRRLVAPYRQF